MQSQTYPLQWHLDFSLTCTKSTGLTPRHKAPLNYFRSLPHFDIRLFAASPIADTFILRYHQHAFYKRAAKRAPANPRPMTGSSRPAALLGWLEEVEPSVLLASLESPEVSLGVVSSSVGVGDPVEKVPLVLGLPLPVPTMPVGTAPEPTLAAVPITGTNAVLRAPAGEVSADGWDVTASGWEVTGSSMVLGVPAGEVSAVG